MEISALKPSVHAADIRIDQLAGNKQVSEREKIGEVSRQFEAVLLRQILGDAQKKVFASTTNPESVSGGIYQDMITNQLADSISRSGGFGLAHSLEKQLQRELKSRPGPASADSKV
jgi:Rod binding domain-containing protein